MLQKSRSDIMASAKHLLRIEVLPQLHFQPQPNDADPDDFMRFTQGPDRFTQGGSRKGIYRQTNIFLDGRPIDSL